MAKLAERFVSFGRWFAMRRKSEIVLYCALLVLVIGFVDYISGIWISLSVVYTLPIWLAAWYVSRRAAYLVALASTVVWMVGDSLSGIPTDRQFILLWNGGIRLMFYAILIVALCRLRDLQNDLARHVRERTAELTAEIAERQRLERQMMDIADHERRRIGQELHDSLSQHLTGTALVCQGLAEKLAARGAGEATDTRKVVKLVEEAIALARRISKGFLPVEIRADGLMQSLDEFAAAVSQSHKVVCLFDCESPVLVSSPSVATHLYRIVQEAVNNALKHSRATRIVIALNVAEQGLILSVTDNGCGLSQTPKQELGMGLNVMADRAKILNGTLTVQTRPEGGTQVLCVIPSEVPANHG